MFSGISKKLDTVANSKRCDDVRPWVHSIVNHLYWCTATSSTAEEKVAKWKSVVNHIQNIHEHDDWHFPVCQHAPIDAKDNKRWLQPSKFSNI